MSPWSSELCPGDVPPPLIPTVAIQFVLLNFNNSLPPRPQYANARVGSLMQPITSSMPPRLLL